MFQNFASVRPGQIFPLPACPAAFPFDAALEALGRGARDLAFVEAAEAIALDRIARLGAMIAACEQEMACGAGAGADAQAELAEAIGVLIRERASLTETLPLERAFRADQRDDAMARVRAAQDWLRAFISSARDQSGLHDPNLAPGEARMLAATALARAPGDLVLLARAEVRARLAGQPGPDPGDLACHPTRRKAALPA